MGSRLKADILAACRAIEAIWPTISPPTLVVDGPQPVTTVRRRDGSAERRRNRTDGIPEGGAGGRIGLSPSAAVLAFSSATQAAELGPAERARGAGRLGADRAAHRDRNQGLVEPDAKGPLAARVAARKRDDIFATVLRSGAQLVPPRGG